MHSLTVAPNNTSPRTPTLPPSADTNLTLGWETTSIRLDYLSDLMDRKLARLLPYEIRNKVYTDFQDTQAKQQICRELKLEVLEHVKNSLNYYDGHMLFKIFQFVKQLLDPKICTQSAIEISPEIEKIAAPITLLLYIEEFTKPEYTLVDFFCDFTPDVENLTESRQLLAHISDLLSDSPFKSIIDFKRDYSLDLEGDFYVYQKESLGDTEPVLKYRINLPVESLDSAQFIAVLRLVCKTIGSTIPTMCFKVNAWLLGDFFDRKPQLNGRNIHTVTDNQITLYIPDNIANISSDIETSGMPEQMKKALKDIDEGLSKLGIQSPEDKHFGYDMRFSGYNYISQRHNKTNKFGENILENSRISQLLLGGFYEITDIVANNCIPYINSRIDTYNNSDSSYYKIPLLVDNCGAFAISRLSSSLYGNYFLEDVIILLLYFEKFSEGLDIDGYASEEHKKEMLDHTHYTIVRISNLTGLTFDQLLQQNPKAGADTVSGVD